MAKAKFSAAGGNGLVLPSDVRWNSVADYLKLISHNGTSFSIFARKISILLSSKKVIGLKHTAQEYLSLLKPIVVAQDILQKKNATISDAVDN